MVCYRLFLSVSAVSPLGIVEAELTTALTIWAQLLYRLAE